MKKFFSIDEKTFGNILKIYRVSNRMTQQRVADYLGVSRSAYAKYETMRKPELDVIVKLSILYNTSLDDFLAPFFGNNLTTVSSANSPDNEYGSLSDGERKLLEFYRGSVRKADILDAAEKIYATDIEIISETKN